METGSAAYNSLKQEYFQTTSKWKLFKTLSKCLKNSILLYVTLA